MRTAVPAVTRLDEFLPDYQFKEVHATAIHGSPTSVLAALKAVTAEEVLLFRTLMAIRLLPAWLRGRGRGRLGAGGRTLLEQFLQAGFVLLAEVPDRELVLGRIGQFWQLRGGVSPSVSTGDEFRGFRLPGFAKAAVSFLVDDRAAESIQLSTETRVYATDPVARRKFAAYWRLIYPGSAFIRLMWLRAVRRRVESATTRPPA